MSPVACILDTRPLHVFSSNPNSNVTSCQISTLIYPSFLKFLGLWMRIFFIKKKGKNHCVLINVEDPVEAACQWCTHSSSLKAAWRWTGSFIFFMVIMFGRGSNSRRWCCLLLYGIVVQLGVKIRQSTI